MRGAGQGPHLSAIVGFPRRLCVCGPVGTSVKHPSLSEASWEAHSECREDVCISNNLGEGTPLRPSALLPDQPHRPGRIPPSLTQGLHCQLAPALCGLAPLSADGSSFVAAQCIPGCHREFLSARLMRLSHQVMNSLHQP